MCDNQILRDMLFLMTTQDISEVLAKNARRLRGRETMASVADRARALGATWSSGTIGGIEGGKARVTVETLVILAATLETTISELLATDGQVAVTEHLVLPPGALQRFLAGGYVESVQALNIPPAEVEPTSTEKRLSKTLEIDPHQLQEVAMRLWSRPFEAERDRLAGEGATRQARAAATRQLLVEVREELGRG